MTSTFPFPQINHFFKNTKTRTGAARVTFAQYKHMKNNHSLATTRGGSSPRYAQTPFSIHTASEDELLARARLGSNPQEYMGWVRQEKLKLAYEKFIALHIKSAPFFGTINFEYPVNQYTAQRYSYNIHTQLTRAYGPPTVEGRWPMFFALELNGDRNGYHIHLVLMRHRRASAERIKKILAKGRFLRDDFVCEKAKRKSIRVDVQDSPTSKCIGYMLKDEFFSDHESDFIDFNKTNNHEK